MSGSTRLRRSRTSSGLRQTLVERMRVSRRLLTRLTRSEALTRGDVALAHREVTELGAELLGVDRVSVWRLDSERRNLECVDLFEKTTGTHSSGAKISAADVPAYFAALSEERCIAAHDAHTDPRTSEFSASYLTPLGIGAMLDAPIWADGAMVGVVCLEHVGSSRKWAFADELLAGTVADSVARVIEAANRMMLKNALRVAQRSASELARLRESAQDRLRLALASEFQDTKIEAQLRQLFDESPVALVVAGDHDGVIRYANRRAAEQFDVQAEELVGRRAPEFFRDPNDARAFRQRLDREGRLEGLVAELQTNSTRVHWALMSAQCVRFDGEACVMIGLSDITAQKLAEHAVLQAAEDVRTLLAAAPIALILSSAVDQSVLLANQSAADLFEMPLADAIGRKTTDFYVNLKERQAILEELRDSGRVDNSLARMRTASGREFWAMFTARVIEFRGQPAFIVGVQDVTDQKRIEDQLRHLAARDPLTGVYNRREFGEIGSQTMAAVRKSDGTAALLMLDIDHFKRINDDHGHAVGDRVLDAVAQRCVSALRGVDVFSRIGGEEFAALLPGASASEAQVVAERVRTAVAALELEPAIGRRVPVTVSVGIAVARDEENLDQLMARADMAMYEAKASGRNRVAIADGPTG